MATGGSDSVLPIELSGCETTMATGAWGGGEDVVEAVAATAGGEDPVRDGGPAARAAAVGVAWAGGVDEAAAATAAATTEDGGMIGAEVGRAAGGAGAAAATGTTGIGTNALHLLWHPYLHSGGEKTVIFFACVSKKRQTNSCNNNPDEPNPR